MAEALATVTAVDHAGADDTAITRFDRIVALHARRPALADRQRSLNYLELAGLVSAVAGAVAAATGGRRDPVGLLLGNDVRQPAAVLGAMRCAIPVVPLDPGHPATRNRWIARNAGFAAIVTTTEFAEQARSLLPAGSALINIDAPGAAAPMSPGAVPAAADIAAIFYTSGSTGRPKGVCVDHAGLLHGVIELGREMNVTPEDRLAVCHPLSLLAGLRTVLSMLLYGGAAHLLPPAQLGGAGLLRELRTRNITLLRCVPTILRRLGAELPPGERIDSLRWIALGGEPADWNDYDIFRRICPASASLNVHISSTEAGAAYARWVVDDSFRGDSPRMPVGRPMPECRVTVVGEDGQPLPPGEIGEFVIASRNVSVGYWRNERLSVRMFGSDPDDPSLRVLRSGDTGCIRPDGLLEFAGRRDRQLKLHGYRVEPGEIEGALRGCRGVRDAAIVIRRDPEGAVRALAAHVELADGIVGLLGRHLQSMLAQRLPHYMVPSSVHLGGALPRLPNLKVDRRALARRDARLVPTQSDREVSPELAQAIAAYERVLGISGVTAEDSLASLGGDSMQAIKVSLELEREFKVEIPLESFEPARSIISVVRQIRAGRRVRAPRTSQAAARGRGRGRRRAGNASLAGQAMRLDQLINSGDVQGAREQAKALTAAGSELRYGRNMARLLERVPVLSEQHLPFEPDPSAEFQFVARSGSDTLLLVFCGAHNAVGIPLRVAHRWFGGLPASVAYLRDLRRSNFLGGIAGLGDDRAAAVAGLRDLAARAGARRILCYGTSAGVHPALDYGLRLGAEAIVSMAGLINLSPAFNLYLRSSWPAARLQREYPGQIIDPRREIEAAQGRVRVLALYADRNWDDRLHAEYLADTPGVRLLPLLECDSHNVLLELIRRDAFEQVLNWLVTPGGVELPDAVAPAAAGDSAAGA